MTALMTSSVTSLAVEMNDAMEDLFYAIAQQTRAIDDPFARFAALLTESWNSMPAESWRKFIADTVHAHPLFEFLQTDPFTRHSRLRPRGYPGDAELLDYIYDHPDSMPSQNAATPLGRAICRYGINRPAPQAVRERRDRLASELQRLALKPGSEALSVACGHLREAELAGREAVSELGRLVAIDQDARSLNLVERKWKGTPVQTRVSDVTRLLRPAFRETLGQFDFVYSAGLFDYLSDRLAARMTGAMLSLCRPGGKLWVFNFTPSTSDVGYMQAVMDWWLVYRNANQMAALAHEQGSAVASWRTFYDATRSVIVLEIIRA
ncbi:MAG: methyltransferase domain-containing protein [Bryobacteraceae bacterium]|nr:methyltransferase domain-containing protein [Bryobacteraceae bacterium]